MNIGEKIQSMREEAGLTQEQLARQIGIDRVALVQIENGKRKVYSEELVKFAQALNCPVDLLLGLKKQPEVVLEREKVKKTESKEMRINVPQKNVRKFKEVFLYLLNKIGSKPNIGETVIYKLLYFIDFNYYEKYEEQLIGATYIKNTYGPTPREFKKVISDMVKNKEVEPIESKHYQYPQKKYLPLRAAALDCLKANELEVIDDVICKLSDMNASQISEYSHNDIPWLTTSNGENIEYEAVFYRTPVYSVRRVEEQERPD